MPPNTRNARELLLPSLVGHCGKDHKPADRWLERANFTKIFWTVIYSAAFAVPAKKRLSGRGRPRFSRKVLPSYSVR
jgi:hypothetical protein